MLDLVLPSGDRIRLDFHVGSKLAINCIRCALHEQITRKGPVALSANHDQAKIPLIIKTHVISGFFWRTATT